MHFSLVAFSCIFIMNFEATHPLIIYYQKLLEICHFKRIINVLGYFSEVIYLYQVCYHKKITEDGHANLGSDDLYLCQ